ncbi:MAG: MBL fold metallo-hydrolase [Clostridiales bacterium]
MLVAATLFSNSRGNAVFVSSEKTKILIDAGVSACKIEKALNEMGESMAEVSAILVTHEHIDHVRSAGSLSRRYNIPIYAAPKVWQEYNGFGNIKGENQAQYEYGMTIGDLSFDFFKTHHDAIQPLGIVVKYQDKKLGICTDTGVFTPIMAEMLKGSNALIFEANHDEELLWHGRYPQSTKKRILGELGHLSNADAGIALGKIITEETKYITLAHLSEENNQPDLAYETVINKLKEQGLGTNIDIQVAPAGHTSRLMVIE